MASGAVFNSDIHISGDVRIDDHAVIAPGVVIIAAPNCYVAIAPGVCLGMGCIVQAHKGNIEIHQGTMVGAGVLIIGQATIEENVCIGFGSTIFRASILSGTILPPNSLIGDVSRQVGVNNPGAKKTPIPQSATPVIPAEADPWTQQQKAKNTEDIPSASAEADNTIFEAPEIEPVEPEITEVFSESTAEKKEITKKDPVVGQVYINQLLMTLFPHNASFKPPDNPSS